MTGQCTIVHGQTSLVTVLRAHHVELAICEQPALGPGGSHRPASRRRQCLDGSSLRLAVAIANPKVAILVPAKLPISFNQ
jgi:hypothetical protein